MSKPYQTRVKNIYTGVEGSATFDESKGMWHVLFDSRKEPVYCLESALQFL